jgi:hypothetical protein
MAFRRNPSVVTSSLKFTDNVKLFFGDGNDTALYWDGTNFKIDLLSGVLNLDADLHLAAAHGLAINGAASPAAQGISASGSTTIVTAAAIGGRVELRDFNGNVWIGAQGTGTTVSNLSQTSGTPFTLKLDGKSHTGLTSGTQAPDLILDFSAIIEHAAGAISEYHTIKVSARTYAFTAASVITNAATLYIDSAPSAGTDATITNGYAAWFGDAIRVDGNINLSNSASNIVLDTTTGTRFGTSSTQKLGFWGTTPITQPSSTGETAGYTSGTGPNLKRDDSTTGNIGSTSYTFGDVVKHLKNSGLIAL